MLFCIIVVFIHAFGTVAARFCPGSIQNILSSAILKNCAFVVQGFIFLSGLKYQILYKEREFNYTGFVFGRVKKILLPYVVSVAGYYFVYYIFGYIDGFSFSDFFGYVIRGDLCSHFYFVVVIMQFYILLPIFLAASKKFNNAILVLCSFLVFVIWICIYWGRLEYADRIFLTYIQYFTLGLAAGNDYKAFKIFLKKHIFIFSALYVLMFFINGFLRQIVLIPGIAIECIHIAYCLSAIMFMSAVLSEDDSVGTITCGINKSSYYIYLWHCILFPFLDKAVDKLKLPELWQVALFRVAGIYAIVLFAVILYDIVYKKTQWAEK